MPASNTHTHTQRSRPVLTSTSNAAVAQLSGSVVLLDALGWDVKRLQYTTLDAAGTHLAQGHRRVCRFAADAQRETKPATPLHCSATGIGTPVFGLGLGFRVRVRV